MKRILFPTLIFAIFCIPALLFGQQAGMSDKIHQLDEIFSGWDSSETPGCAVGVADRSGPLVTRAYGMADLEHYVPNTPSTIFEAGSVSKQFVTASVILLALEGELSLNDDIGDYVPELPEYGHTITLRNLMNHTSGLRDWGSVAAISGWGRSNRTHNHNHVLDILSRQTSLNFAPDERYSYSNSGYNLLAIVVERVSGMPFAEYSTKNLFEPLGMTQTQWRDDYTRIVKNRSSAYSGNADSDRFSINRPIEHVHGNGGLLTTVGDLLIWTRALDTGYFGQEFMDELLKQGVLNSDRTISYASAVRVDNDHGHKQVTHTGATSGYRAYLSWFPEQGLSVSLLCNVTGANPGSLGSSISGIFLEKAEEEKTEHADGITLRHEQLEVKTGIYADPRNHSPTIVEMSDDTLRMNNGPALIPLSDYLFRVGNSETHFRFFESDHSNELGIQVIREGYEEEVLTSVNIAKSSSDLTEYHGNYYGEDAETRIRITSEEGKLMAHRRPSDLFEVEPVYEDAFRVNGFGLIRFFRDEQGNISNFAYSAGRVYDLRFYKEPE